MSLLDRLLPKLKAINEQSRISNSDTHPISEHNKQEPSITASSSQQSQIFDLTDACDEADVGLDIWPSAPLAPTTLKRPLEQAVDDCVDDRSKTAKPFNDKQPRLDEYSLPSSYQPIPSISRTSSSSSSSSSSSQPTNNNNTTSNSTSKLTLNNYALRPTSDATYDDVKTVNLQHKDFVNYEVVLYVDSREKEHMLVKGKILVSLPYTNNPAYNDSFIICDIII